MLKKFIQLCLIFIIAAGGYILYVQPDLRAKALSYVPLSSLPLKDVKGINTGKVGSVSGQLKKDVESGAGELQKQALNIKVGDLINFVNRSQKIARDFRSFQDYLREQTANLGKK